MPGFLGALIAKLVGGTVAKAALATTAALTMVVGGGAAAGIIPTGGDTDPVAVAQPAVDQANDAADAAVEPAPPAAAATEPAADEASVTPPAASASASADANTAAAPAADMPDVPDVSTLIPEAVVPPCVSDLVPSGGSVPDPTQLVSQLPTCILSVVTANLPPLDLIEQAIGSANLPVDVSGCLTSVLASLPTFVSGDLSGLSGILSDCLPTGGIPGSEAGSGSSPGSGSDFGSGAG
jgi:hypothetical protein